MNCFTLKNAGVLFLSAGALLGTLLHSENASATWRTCAQVTNVTFVDDAGGDNIEVQCATAYTTGITWAGYLTTSAGDAERFMSIVLAALLSGKGFSINMGTTPCPSATANCRLGTSFGVYNQ